MKNSCISRAIALVFVAALAGCGEKTMESAAAKQVGAAPKQTVDKVVNDAGKALQQADDRTRNAD